MYAVVLFIEEEDAAAVVPEKWLFDDDQLTFWPTCIKSRFGHEKMIKELMEPEEDWAVYKVRVLKKGIDTYLEARKKCKLAEKYSDLEVEFSKREKRPTCRYEQISSSDDKKPPPTKRLKKPTSRDFVLKPPVMYAGKKHELLPETNEPSLSRQEIVKDECHYDLASINRKLTHLQNSVDSLTNMMAAISEKLSSLTSNTSQADSSNLGLMEIFPLKTVEDFEKLEEDLKNASFQNTCMKIINMTGGASVKNACQNILRKIFTDDLAVKFSYKGQVEGKKSFCATQLFRIVKHVLQKGYLDASDVNIKNIVSEWLTQAKFRKNKKEERARLKTIEDTIQQENEKDLSFEENYS